MINTIVITAIIRDGAGSQAGPHPDDDMLEFEVVDQSMPLFADR